MKSFAVIVYPMSRPFYPCIHRFMRMSTMKRARMSLSYGIV